MGLQQQESMQMHSKVRHFAVLAMIDVKPALKKFNTSSYYSRLLIIVHSSIFGKFDNLHLLCFKFLA